MHFHYLSHKSIPFFVYIYVSFVHIRVAPELFCFLLVAKAMLYDQVVLPMVDHRVLLHQAK